MFVFDCLAGFVGQFNHHRLTNIVYIDFKILRRICTDGRNHSERKWSKMFTFGVYSSRRMRQRNCTNQIYLLAYIAYVEKSESEFIFRRLIDMRPNNKSTDALAFIIISHSTVNTPAVITSTLGSVFCNIAECMHSCLALDVVDIKNSIRWSDLDLRLISSTRTKSRTHMHAFGRS